MCAALSHVSCVRLFATLWPVAHQAPLSMGFSRQEYWSGSHALLHMHIYMHTNKGIYICISLQQNDSYFTHCT